MKNYDAWKTFTQTGKITDYMNYINSENDAESGSHLNLVSNYNTNSKPREINDNKNKGISN